MNHSGLDDLRKAYKKEKDPRIIKRMLAVHMVRINGKNYSEAADCLMQCPDWVKKWVNRFEDAGIDGLRDISPEAEKP